MPHHYAQCRIHLSAVPYVLISLSRLMCLIIWQTVSALLVECLPSERLFFPGETLFQNSSQTENTGNTTSSLVLGLNATQQNTHEADGESFVEESAAIWVITVISGTCILTIAFIVRALFSRAEAFRDPQEIMFNPDMDDAQMGIGSVIPGSDLGYL
ncbi:hypothetical protein CSKR_110830 [Clonorchis sinensis]|uniref:Uncharacterized protein n=2 Tax=Clonorchis sinensis TaxID=79923 RepID=A0A8T1MUI8_CLOSI|nr:hypothetical protein CSKR_110830 [Clonorchis sinensis]GAA50247.1 hypothetical protein CLF_104283 [Clonorchis sinensis]